MRDDHPDPVIEGAPHLERVPERVVVHAVNRAFPPPMSKQGDAVPGKRFVEGIATG